MSNRLRTLIDRLALEQNLSDQDLTTLLTAEAPDADRYLAKRADEIRQQIYGKDVYIRGLIEFTNYCRNDCYYCGIRRSRKSVSRYRLSPAEILSCCQAGYQLGFRTFVLQGGEDPFWTDDRLVPLIKTIAETYPDCALTLSAGERSRESYQRLFDAGADRYLLRHETATESHYAKLHPVDLSFANRMECLQNLKDIGYQTGCGFMVGSPGQTMAHILRDLRFIQEFKPHMVGIGPFLPASDTPFEGEAPGSAHLTVRLLSVIRLMLPSVLLPATTALGTAETDGREKGILAGANVIMPNLSPTAVRSKYSLYNDKISTGDEAAESIARLRQSMEKLGYQVVTCRGDYLYQ